MAQLRLPSGDGGGQPKRLLAFMGGCLELAMGTLFYGIYTDTIGLMSNVYLSELPGIGQLFGLIDEEMTVSHLLAAMLAFFSCAVPIYIWSVILNEKIYEEPRAWLSKPLNQIKAGFMLFIFILVFALEVTNLYTLIAQHKNAGPLPTGDDGEMLSYLADNAGLGIFVSALVAIINTVIAMLTVKAIHSFKSSWE